VTRRKPTDAAPERDASLCDHPDGCTRKRWGDDPLCRRHLVEVEQAMQAPDPVPTAPVE